jgi:tetratricopeptide (TPR) repeat protein
MKGIQNTADGRETSSTFGATLRALRHEQGMSLAALAGHTHYSRGHLNNVEHGLKAPTVELAQSCDQALSSGNALRSLVPERHRSSPTGSPRPAQLPASSRRFVGRGRYLRQLDLLLADPHRAPIGAIHGAPGVGKTELALQWAHHHTARFTDGQLFADLHGHTSSGNPVEPADALEDFLLALGWPPDRMPAIAEERASLFRTVTQDRRMIFLFDNAASSAQVRPLLPTGSGNIVLVTSRARLEGLAVREGASDLALAPFEPNEALTLLRGVVGPGRVDKQIDKSIEVVERCGCLPLAVRLAAERVASRPNFTMEVLAADLAEERARLDALSAGDDEDTAVRAVFSWSYRNLPSPTARMFRLLGLHLGPDITVPAAAALADLTVGQARMQLEILANGHLVEQPRPGRFRLHNLMHLYAAERCTTEETEQNRQQAVERELTYYLHMAQAADYALRPSNNTAPPPRHGETPPAPLFPDYHEALMWCDSELGNLVRSAQTAFDHDMLDIAWHLSAALFEFFHVRKPWNNWEKTYRVGLAAARGAHSQFGEAFMHQGLGLVCLGRSLITEARAHYDEALRLRLNIDDRAGQGWSRAALGQILTTLREFDEAAINFEQALALHHDVGEVQGEAVASLFLSDLRREQGATDEAIECSQRALTLTRSISDRHGEGLALHQLGNLCLATDRVPEALSYLVQTIEVQQTAGDRKGEADTHRLLANAMLRVGRAQEAKPHLIDALAIFEARDDPAADDVRLTLRSLADS